MVSQGREAEWLRVPRGAPGKGCRSERMGDRRGSRRCYMMRSFREKLRLTQKRDRRNSRERPGRDRYTAMRNCAPSAVLHTEIVPDISFSTIFFDMKSPRPVPFPSRFVVK